MTANYYKAWSSMFLNLQAGLYWYLLSQTAIKFHLFLFSFEERKWRHTMKKNFSLFLYYLFETNQILLVCLWASVLQVFCIDTCFFLVCCLLVLSSFFICAATTFVSEYNFINWIPKKIMSLFWGQLNYTQRTVNISIMLIFKTKVSRYDVIY